MRDMRSTGWDKTRIAEIARIVVIALLALAGAFGYDIGVIQPREDNAASNMQMELDRVALLAEEATGDAFFSPAGTRGIGDSNFTNVVASGDITAGDDLLVDDAANIRGATWITGTLRVDATSTFNGGIFTARMSRVAASTTITAVDGAAFSLGGSWQPITAAAAVTPIMNVPAVGSLVCLENIGANAITFTDSGTQVLSGDAVLGQYDVLCVYSDGTRVIEVARRDN